MKRHSITVRKYLPGQSSSGSDYIGKITGDFGTFETVETISRVLRAEQIGNFNPIFCTYKGKRCLVHSEEGDLSDPFRRDQSYVQSLFITIPHGPAAVPELFKADINLDDESEAREFIETHGTRKGRGLANSLGFHGKGATAAAGALSNYAWNKATACDCRLKGDIPAALVYEAICDRIYSEDIKGKIDCW
jgi:hypothetical protein